MTPETVHGRPVEWYRREVTVSGNPGWRSVSGFDRRDRDVPIEAVAVGDVLMMNYVPGGEVAFAAKLVERRWENNTLTMVVVEVPAFESDLPPTLVPADEHDWDDVTGL